MAGGYFDYLRKVLGWISRPVDAPVIETAPNPYRPKRVPSQDSRTASIVSLDQRAVAMRAIDERVSAIKSQDERTPNPGSGDPTRLPITSE